MLQLLLTVKLNLKLITVYRHRMKEIYKVVNIPKHTMYLNIADVNLPENILTCHQDSQFDLQRTKISFEDIADEYN